MIEPIERFTNRVENYVKYRPSYPSEILRFFSDNLGLTTNSIVADIGSGTGISAKIFLENGNIVYGVEPNAAMRGAAENFLAEFWNFKSIEGTSENTTLPDKSVDFVIAAQAFHWFDAEKARKEFDRILKLNGYVALIWNERKLDANDFLRDYENFLLEFEVDYRRVRHENISAEDLKGYFPNGLKTVVFQNSQDFDFAGLRGRTLSSSYMPNATDKKFPAMEEKLKQLFTKHAESGKISLQYDTRIYYGQF